MSAPKLSEFERYNLERWIYMADHPKTDWTIVLELMPPLMPKEYYERLGLLDIRGHATDAGRAALKGNDR